MHISETTSTGNLWSWPSARIEGDMLVSDGPELRVRPDGVRHSGDPSKRGKLLPKSPQELWVELTSIETVAEWLRFAASGVIPDLCLEHGRPTHAVERSDGAYRFCGSELSDGRQAVRIDHVLSMIDSLQSVERLAAHIRSQRSGVTLARIESALAWPSWSLNGEPGRGPWFRRMVDWEIQANGKVSSKTARRLVIETVNRLMEETHVTPRFDWPPHQGPPQFALRVRSGVALYVANLATRLGHTPTVDQTRVCETCGNTFRTSRSDKRHCGRPDCDRLRARERTARRRAASRET